MKNTEKIQSLKDRLEKLTKFMNVPCHKYSNIKWLEKNLESHNKTHPDYEEARGLVDELIKLGASQ